MEYLIAVSVVAMMTAYVWNSARCLQARITAQNARTRTFLGSRESFAMN
jgi:hypothetical protein